MSKPKVSESPRSASGKSTTDLTTPDADSTTTPVVPFTNAKALFDMLELTRGDCLQLGNVSVDAFHAVEEMRDASDRRYLLFFLAETGTLIVTIPRYPHEMLHRSLDTLIGWHAYRMGLGSELQSVGAPTLRDTGGGGAIRASLEGDSCLVPHSKSGADVWPVLVIEAGYTQSIPQLRMRARTWFLASNFEVKIVILAKMVVSEGTIVLEKWKGVQRMGVQRTGAMMTRASSNSPRTPECVQTIRISRPGVPAGDPRVLSPACYRVSRGALTLEFEELFLRAASGDEADIVIDEQELKEYAVRVWERHS